MIEIDLGISCVNIGIGLSGFAQRHGSLEKAWNFRIMIPGLEKVWN